MCAPSTCTGWATSTSPSPIAIGRWRPPAWAGRACRTELAAGDQVVVRTRREHDRRDRTSVRLKESAGQSVGPSARTCSTCGERLAQVARASRPAVRPRGARTRRARGCGCARPPPRPGCRGRWRSARRRRVMAGTLSVVNGTRWSAQLDAPAHLPAEPMLGFVGDLHALGAGVLPEARRPRGRDGCGAGLGALVVGQFRGGDGADRRGSRRGRSRSQGSR